MPKHWRRPFWPSRPSEPRIAGIKQDRIEGYSMRAQQDLTEVEHRFARWLAHSGRLLHVLFYLAFLYFITRYFIH